MNPCPLGRRSRGFTLIELAVVMAVVSLLALIAYPSFQGLVLKGRRGDGQVALLRAQQSQERWRAQNSRYANAEELQLPETSPLKHYRLAVRSATEAGFELVAVALDAQTGDAVCRVLRIEQLGGETVYGSGPDELARNAGELNRRCWQR